MKNFSKEKESPHVHTSRWLQVLHIGIDAKGARGSYLNVEVWMMKGEYDDQLQWPATAKFTLELINHFENGENKTCTITPTWGRPTEEYDELNNDLTVPDREYRATPQPCHMHTLPEE